MRKKRLLVLAVVVGLGAALVVWFAAEDARQAALLDARVRQAEDRVTQARDRYDRLCQDKAPAEEARQAAIERVDAVNEFLHRRAERNQRREASWPARLRAEVYRRLGW